ncbi:MAG: hypothetical protein M3157_06290 [Actinomycetota bacterium]|nr:hypothetical protein [Actinomycetota bacterium]
MKGRKVRKLKVFMAMLAMVLMAASPVMAQSVEFVEDGVLIIVEGTGSLEEAPITGLFAVPEFGAGAVAGGDALFIANPDFGAFGTTGGASVGAAQTGDVFLQSGALCFDTTDMDLCP